MKKCDSSECEEYIHEVCYLYDTYKLNRATIKAITSPPFGECTGVFINSKSIETKSKEYYCPNHKRYVPYYLPYSIQMKIVSFKQTKYFCEIDSIYTDREKYNKMNSFNQCKYLLHEIVQIDEHDCTKKSSREFI